MATLSSLVVNDTGNLTLPSGTTAQRVAVYSTDIIKWTNTGTQAFTVLSGSTTPTSTTWTCPAGITSIEVLVVAGGGFGHTGGGGAGGLIYQQNFPVTPTTVYTVTVGAGGTSGTGNGSNSVFGSLTAIGGGMGDNTTSAATGGSGGGGATNSGGTVVHNGGNGTYGQGCNGGTGTMAGGYGKGGGGGAGSRGDDGFKTKGGNGGVGLLYDISGTPTWYAGGGGGGASNTASPGISFGGRGGGGNGGQGTTTGGTAGVSSTGGGGGGGTAAGTTTGIGGSGIVVIRYTRSSSTTVPIAQTRFNSTLGCIETYGANNTWNPEYSASTTGIVSSGLVIHWDPNAYTNATTLTDLSGNGYHGTLNNNPHYCADNGGHLIFNAYNTSITNATYKVTGARSTFLWIYYNSVTVSTAGYTLNGVQETNAYNYIGIIEGGQGYQFVGSGASGGNYNYVFKANKWYNVGFTMDNGGSTKFYVDGILVDTKSNGVGTTATANFQVGAANNAFFLYGRIGNVVHYSRAITEAEILQNYNTHSKRFSTLPTETVQYVPLSFTTTSTTNIAVTQIGPAEYNIFKVAGSATWDSQAFCTDPFTAPCTIEFYKRAAQGGTDNGLSYVMISWNADPTTDASYTSMDWAVYPYYTTNYVTYHNGAGLAISISWDPNQKFYLVYDIDGYIKHYNGSTLLYSIYKGPKQTVFFDTSFYSVDASQVYGGISNLRITKNAWNGTQYI